MLLKIETGISAISSTLYQEEIVMAPSLSSGVRNGEKASILFLTCVCVRIC